MDDDTGTPTTWLVSAAQGGDRRALEGLFARYLPRVRQIVALRLGRRSRDIEELEDIVQEALLNVFQNLRKYRKMSEARFRSWIAACVTNSVRAHVRGARALKRSSTLPCYPYPADDLAAAVLSDSPGPREVAEGEELADRIEGALLGLKPAYREAIILSRLCEMSSEEVAAAMGLPSAAAARKLLSRAVEKLREMLGGE